MSDLDNLLRERLTGMYPPADPAGVVEAVRARVLAGESGYVPPAGSVLPWLPWIGGAVLVAGLVTGAGLVAGGGQGSDAASQPPVTTAVRVGADARACPDSETVGVIGSGSRVLALGRSEDGGWIEVRDPSSIGRTVWVAAEDLVADEGTFESLPSAGCAVTSVATVPVDVVTAAPSAPAPTPEQPAADATPPTLTAGSVTYSPAQGFVCTEQPASTATVSVTAADNVGVASVVATWGGSQPGSGALSPSGASWVLPPYRPTNLSITESIPFTLVARDAAGNASAPLVVSVQRDQCPG